MPELTDSKVVFFNGLSQQEAIAAMRAIKAAVEHPEAIAFAMATPSNLDWPVRELVRHVAEEHREMTGYSDPD